MALLAERGGRVEQRLQRLPGCEQPADGLGVPGAGDPDRLGGRDHKDPSGQASRMPDAVRRPRTLGILAIPSPDAVPIGSRPA